MLDFLVAGVQKGGTTALWHYLRQHRDVRFSELKELHFFDNDEIDWDNPPYAYLDIVTGRSRPGAVRGEATPSYIYWPQSLERIRAYNAAIKLIVVLRDPVQRAYSHWRMAFAKGSETLRFGKAIRWEPARLMKFGGENGAHRMFSYVERGFYARQLARVFALFPREQVLLLRHQDLKGDHARVLDRACAFLSIDRFARHPEPETVYSLEGQADIPAMTGADAAYLRAMYRDDLKCLEREYGIALAPET